MATVAGSRVNATVENVPAKVISAMGHAAVIFSLVFDGGFQLDSDPVAIAAETCPVTGGTNRTISTGCLSMVVAKKRAVYEFFIGNLRLLRFMAIQAKTQIFTVFIRVPGRRRITTLDGCTGNHEHNRQNTQDKSRQFFIFHRCFPYNPIGSSMDRFAAFLVRVLYLKQPAEVRIKKRIMTPIS